MLYLVTTPIGNLGDITLRALDVLKSVDLILCEDTRHSQVLLAHYNISCPLSSYEKFSESKKTALIIEKLKKGENIALITDAGTPSISDPGFILVKKLIEEELEYTVVGSTCALISALVLSGHDTSNFAFVGFLPERKSAKTELLEKFSKLKSTLIFYVSPHNAIDDIVFLYEQLGPRKACLVREISKMHEEKIHFILGDDLSDKTIKGELVLVVDGDDSKPDYTNLSIEEHFKNYLNQGFSEKDAMKAVAKDRGISKSDVYSVVKIK